MVSMLTTLKKASVAFVGLAIVVSAVHSVPASAQYQTDRKKNDDSNLDMVWVGAGGSMLWFFVNSGSQSQPDALADVGGSKTTQSCTTSHHGQTTPCNGFSP